MIITELKNLRVQVVTLRCGALVERRLELTPVGSDEPLISLPLNEGLVLAVQMQLRIRGR